LGCTVDSHAQSGVRSLSFPQICRNGVWSTFLAFDRVTPIRRGKYRLASLLKCAIGLPVRSVSGVFLEWFPTSSADEWIAECMDHDSGVHQAMEKYLKPESVFVDIGGNVGLFSILARKKYGCEVVVFEPSPREVAALRKNAALNGVELNICNVALGQSDGELLLQMEDAGNHTMNRVVQDASWATNTIRCPVRRLDEMLSPEQLRRVSLVKIDVEGFEMDVLLGLEKAAYELQGAAFVIEITPAWLEQNGHSAQALYQFMERHGWRP
jgi:FkbM family methyltransferase